MTMTLSDDSVSMANTLFMNGEEVGESGFGASLPYQPYGVNYGSGVMGTQYSCDENKLYLNFLPDSDTLPPLLFDRDL